MEAIYKNYPVLAFVRVYNFIRSVRTYEKTITLIILTTFPYCKEMVILGTSEAFSKSLNF